MKISLKKGFTLIELLVVISIIALLTSVVLGQLNDARAKARDRALVQQVHQIQNALELYRNKYGEYPDGSHGNPAFSSYISRITSTGALLGYGGGETDANSIATRLKEFLPEITKPRSGTEIKYYNAGSQGTNLRATWCSDAGGPGPLRTAPPYTIWVTFETSFSDQFPHPVYYTDTTQDRTAESCFSLK